MNFDLLTKHVPESSLPILKEWFCSYDFILAFSRTRNTKLGDFRAKRGTFPHRISVNKNLNEYAFLITLTHEFAHLLVWEKFKNRIQPHGLEWKNQFADLMRVLLEKNIFPTDLATILLVHIKNPAASSVRDFKLTLALKKYDIYTESAIHLVDLPEGAIFSLKNKRTFTKGKKRRTRYLCLENATKRQYLIHGAAEVLVD
ncbi:MAG: SprT-like domain-containing protein [Flavobacteriales bacterium]